MNPPGEVLHHAHPLKTTPVGAVIQQPACPSTGPPPSAPWGPVSSMQLELEEDDEEEDEEVSQQGIAPGTRSEEPLPGTEQQGAPQDPAWDGGGGGCGTSA